MTIVETDMTIIETAIQGAIRGSMVNAWERVAVELKRLADDGKFEGMSGTEAARFAVGMCEAMADGARGA